MRRWTKAIVGVAAVLLMVTLPALPAGASTVSDESDFVARINALRSSKGLAPLVVDAELTSIARQWAGKMAAAGKISHNANFPAQVTQNWKKLGENVGVGPEVPGLHDAFVRSPGHYANLVDPAFTRIGVGVVRTADGLIYTAHQFMELFAAAAPAPAPVASAPKPPPAPAPAPAPATTTVAARRPTRGPLAGLGTTPVAPAAAAKPVLAPAALSHALTGLRLLDAA